MLVNVTDGSPIADAASRYTFPLGCPAPNQGTLREEQYLPTRWAESLYVAPYELEAQGSSAMPLEAIFDIERYSEEEICNLKPSFCAYNAKHGYPNAVPGAPLLNDYSQVDKSCKAHTVLDMAVQRFQMLTKRKDASSLVIFGIGICIGFFFNFCLLTFFQRKQTVVVSQK